MGFFFRKSVNVGPFRLNLSKSGVGYSVGTKGVRLGRSARGRNYTTFGLPGTGVGYSASRNKLPIPGVGKGMGCMVVILASLVATAIAASLI